MNNLHLMNDNSEEPYEVINNSLEDNMSSNIDSSNVEKSKEDNNLVNDDESDDESDGEYENQEYENQEYNKWKYSILGGLVFFILSSPIMYKIVNVLLNNILQIINKHGCPNMYGLLIHSIVYTLLIIAMMNLNI